jgi:hypothetical protein
VARARGRCLAANTVTPAIASVGGESAELMIAPASRSGSELVHIAHSIRDHFTRSLIVARERKCGDRGDEAGGADDREERSTMRRQFDPAST